MKSVILVLCALAASVPADALNFWKRGQYFHECLDEFDLSKGEYKQLLWKKDPKAGCVVACYMEKKDEMFNGIIDEKRMMHNMKHVAKKIGYKEYFNVLTTCKAKVEDITDKCEKAMKMRTCRKKELWRLRTERRMQKRIIFKNCLAQNNLTREEYIELKKNGESKAGCVMACVMEAKAQLVDGQFVKENILSQMPNQAVMRIGKNKLSTVVDTCISETDDVADKCEKALVMKTCRRREMWKLHVRGLRKRSSKEQCLRKYNITREEYKVLKSNGELMAGKVMACVMKKKGEMMFGKFNHDKIIDNMHYNVVKKIGKDRLYEIVGSCADKAEELTTSAEKALAMKTCLREAKERELGVSQ